MAASCASARAFAARPCGQRAARRAPAAPRAFFSNISKTVSKTVKGGVEKALEKASSTVSGTQSGSQSGSQGGTLSGSSARPTAVRIKDAGSHSRKGTAR